MTDKEAYEATLSLYKYCEEHPACEGCIFRCNSYCRTDRNVQCNLFDGLNIIEVKKNYEAKLLGATGPIFVISDRP